MMKSLEWFETILRVIYLLFMILVIVFIIWIWVSPPGGNNVDEVDEIVIVEPNEEITNNDSRMKPIQRNFDNLNEINFSLDTSPDPESTLTYSEFKTIVNKPEFIVQFTNSLRSSFIQKRHIYIQKQKQVMNDLKAKNAKSGFTSMLEHDVNRERLYAMNGELKMILNAIDKRIDTLNVDVVRSGLEQALYDPYSGIDSVVGRNEVKDFLALQLYTFAQSPKIFFTNFQNIAIYGPSGVGKTKLAQTIAFVYASSGILVRNKFRSITKQELTTAYVNESSQLTREMLMSTLEGICFIDEAYDLAPENTMFGKMQDHGRESIAEMVNFLDKHIGLSVVIVAGYEKDMERRFMTCNEGMPRRFPHVIRLNGYDSSQLTNLLLTFMLQKSPEIKLNDEESNYLYALIDYTMRERTNIFSKHAGDMLNLAGHLIRAIYGSKEFTWSPTNHETNNRLLLKGFNDYLRGEGISIKN